MTQNSLIVRAITYFTPRVETREELESIIHRANEIHSVLEKTLENQGYHVFTKRISLPGPRREIIYKLVDYLERGLLVSTGYNSEYGFEDIIEFTSKGLFVPVLYNKEPSIDKAREYSSLIHKIASINPENATRFAIGFHDEYFQTPYFPDSSSRGSEAIGLAFLYPELVLRKLKEGLTIWEAFRSVFREVNRVVEITRNTTGLPVFVDYSLSPWMENSVVQLYVEAGYSVLDSSGVYYTWLLNKVIDDTSDSSIRIGFNEVMLPYAEDSILLEYGRRGLIRARDLLLLASTCVAGVDMIVVPENTESLARIIAGLMSIKYVKKKPLSIRAIPVSSKPGDTVDLGRFGRVVVIDY